MKLDQAKLMFNEKRSLTQAVVSVVSQAEPVVARAPVVTWDVDALVDTTSVVFGHTFVYICREKMQENVKASSLLKHRLGKETHLFCSRGQKKKKSISIESKEKFTSQVIRVT